MLSELLEEKEVRKLLKNPNTPWTTIKHILDNVNHIVYKKRNAKAGYTMAKAAIIRSCVNHPNFDLSSWKTYYYDIVFRKELAKRENLTEEIFVSLAKERAPIRQSIAMNPNCSVSVLRELARDSNSKVVEEVAFNSSTPFDVLQELSKSSDNYIVYRVSINPGAPKELLLEMLDRIPSKVIPYIYRNPSLGVDYIRDVWIQTRRLEEKVDKESALLSAIYRNLAWNPILPEDVMYEMIEKNDPEILYRLAYNPSTPDSILFVLLNDTNEDVRWRVKFRLKSKKQVERMYHNAYKYGREIIK